MWSTRHQRLHAWRWWQYTFRESFVDARQANVALLANCGYKLEPSKPMRMTSCRPGFNLRRFRFGFYVSASPVHHKSRHWQMYWCRWIDDPVELFLVRCALRLKYRNRSPSLWNIRSHVGKPVSDIL